MFRFNEEKYVKEDIVHVNKCIIVLLVLIYTLASSTMTAYLFMGSRITTSIQKAYSVSSITTTHTPGHRPISSTATSIATITKPTAIAKGKSNIRINWKEYTC